VRRSLTILPTALIDNGSRTNEVIFGKLKGPGNMEMNLDCDWSTIRRGGPGANPKFIYGANVLLFGSDPVAVDAVAHGIIGMERIARGVQRVDSPGRSTFLELVTSLLHDDPALA
jgi:hypothetical protein